MGVHDWYPFAADNGIHGTRVSQEDTKSLAVDIDLLGLHYWLIVSTLHEDDVSQAEANRATPSAGNTSSTHLHHVYATNTGYTSTVTTTASVSKPARALNAVLLAHFNPKLTVVHIDGGRTVEKQDVHAQRDTDRASVLRICLELSVSNLAASRQGIPGKQVKQCWEKLKSGRPILQSDKVTIRRDLEKLGWQVCMCTGESDTCIARALQTDGTRYMVSRDSDMFLHSSVGNMLRPFKNFFLSYNREDILTALGLKEVQMQLLAIVSRSDFTQNVDGMGLKRNCEFIKTLPTNLTLDKMLQLYVTRVGQVDTTRSMSIFVDRQEQLLTQDANSDLDDQFQTYMSSVKMMVAARTIHQELQKEFSKWSLEPLPQSKPTEPPTLPSSGTIGQRYMMHSELCLNHPSAFVTNMSDMSQIIQRRLQRWF